MGTRFRKTTKISKGTKLNFSKSGTSVSLGGPGHSINIGAKGVRVTTGIPGTGFSYSTKIGGRQNTTGAKIPASFTLSLDENGQLVFYYASGFQIKDETVIRRIKTTDEYKRQKAILDEKKLEKLDEIVKEAAEENAKFINIHTFSTNVFSKEAFEQEINNLAPEEYYEEKPDEESVSAELAEEAETMIKGLFAAKKKKQYIEDNLPNRLAEQLTKWETAKATAEAEFKAEYEKEKAVLFELLNGKEETICQVFDNWISDIELPVEIGLNYDWNANNKTMMIDVDLPEIEDLPDTIMMRTDTGKLKEKKKTVSEKRTEYVQCVFGLAVFICSNAFNISPEVQRILISGYTQRRDKEGNLNDEYIYSAKILRESFEGKEISTMDPQKLISASENRCNTTSTGLFKTIKPYEAFE